MAPFCVRSKYFRAAGGRYPIIGGSWRFVNRHPEGEAAFHGEYREITPPSRLVFTEIFQEYPDSVSVVTAVFTDEGGKTRFSSVQPPAFGLGWR